CGAKNERLHVQPWIKTNAGDPVPRSSYASFTPSRVVVTMVSSFRPADARRAQARQYAMAIPWSLDTPPRRDKVSCNHTSLSEHPHTKEGGQWRRGRRRRRKPDGR